MDQDVIWFDIEWFLEKMEEEGKHCGAEQPRVQTEVLGQPLVHLLVRSHCSLICLLRTAWFALLRSLIRLLTHFAHSRACGTVNDWVAIYSEFFSTLDHSGKEGK